VIVHDGMQRMYEKQENVFYYLTCMNENYTHPAMPAGAEEGILKGMYVLKESATADLQLLGSGTILREVEAAADILAKDYNVQANVWSVTSFNELRRDGLETERWNALHPQADSKRCYVEEKFAEHKDTPFVVATDYMKIVPDQIRQWVPNDFHVLGTDGFGRSDGRKSLRRHFEVDRYYVTVAALYALQKQGKVEASVVQSAIEKFNIDADRISPEKA